MAKDHQYEFLSGSAEAVMQIRLLDHTTARVFTYTLLKNELRLVSLRKRCPSGVLLPGRRSESSGWWLHRKDERPVFHCVDGICSPVSLMSALIKGFILGDLFSHNTFYTHLAWASWLHNHELRAVVISYHGDAWWRQMWGEPAQRTG